MINKSLQIEIEINIKISNLRFKRTRSVARKCRETNRMQSWNIIHKSSVFCDTQEPKKKIHEKNQY